MDRGGNNCDGTCLGLGRCGEPSSRTAPRSQHSILVGEVNDAHIPCLRHLLWDPPKSNDDKGFMNLVIDVLVCPDMCSLKEELLTRGYTVVVSTSSKTKTNNLVTVLHDGTHIVVDTRMKNILETMPESFRKIPRFRSILACTPYLVICDIVSIKTVYFVLSHELQKCMDDYTRGRYFDVLDFRTVLHALHPWLDTFNHRHRHDLRRRRNRSLYFQLLHKCE